MTRTVIDYVRLVLVADSTSYADLQTMVRAMVTYGGYAQKYFGVDTGNLAYSVLTECNIDLPDISTVTVGEDQVLTITSNTAAAATSISESGDNTETDPTETETAAGETDLAETTEAVETEPEETEAPETTPPTTAPPATEPPATNPPATEPPATQPPVPETSRPADDGDNWETDEF